MITSGKIARGNFLQFSEEKRILGQIAVGSLDEVEGCVDFR